MSDILSSLITPEMQAFLVILIIVLVILYLMSIVWTVRDSYLRGSNPLMWGLIAVIPFVGCMIYAMMRPPLYASDREEQNIGLLLQQRELMSYGECPKCGYPTERSYVICPNCHTRLRNVCGNCGKTLEPEWNVCPYCATQVGHAGGQRTAGTGRRVQRASRQPGQLQQPSAASVSRAASAQRPQAGYAQGAGQPQGHSVSSHDILTQNTPPARTSTRTPNPGQVPRT